MCGGTGWRLILPPTQRGLSPRVRGNLLHLLLPLAQGRSIPACAGEPPGCLPQPEPLSVYPRVCGGTLVSRSAVYRRLGLSPRVRGNRRLAVAVQRCRRSIPACAGEPQRGYRYQPAGTVYPRVCGGTLCSDNGSRLPLGLSPRVRGNRPPLWRKCPPARSIPACAGEPGRERGCIMPTKVYPRVCGGTAIGQLAHSPPGGLSPRVRGNRRASTASVQWPWSIPACAGEPSFASWTSMSSTVYPRVCGGTKATQDWVSCLSGLSPRVRGNPSVRPRPAGDAGSIPACAGEPLTDQVRRDIGGVYPRVCGGTAITLYAALSGMGLSPRVRGNLNLLTNR